MTDQSELIRAVSDLTKSVGELSERLDMQEKLLTRIEAQRRGLNTTRIAVGFTLLLIVAVGFLYRQVDANTRDVRDVQRRTSTEVLCPLYEVFALSIKANPNPAGLTPEQAAVRQQAGDTITAGLQKLGCA